MSEQSRQILETKDISLILPTNPYATLYVHLTKMKHCNMIHLTSTDLNQPSSAISALGSFVYAMPDTQRARSAISTVINTEGSSIDYATRMARILAIKMKKPVYVGCSINFAGSTMEEEMNGLTCLVEQIMHAFST